MSNPIVKAERSKAKDARQSPALDHIPRYVARRKKKPYALYIKLFGIWWYKKKYATRAGRQKALLAQLRKDPLLNYRKEDPVED